jgi:hypothetical protein
MDKPHSTAALAEAVKATTTPKTADSKDDEAASTAKNTEDATVATKSEDATVATKSEANGQEASVKKRKVEES